MDEIGQAVPFYSGADYENLARDYGRQWPCTKDRPLGTKSPFRRESVYAETVLMKRQDRPFKFVADSQAACPAANPKGFPAHAGVRKFALLLEPECAGAAQRDAEARVSPVDDRLS